MQQCKAILIILNIMIILPSAVGSQTIQVQGSVELAERVIFPASGDSGDTGQARFDTSSDLEFSAGAGKLASASAELGLTMGTQTDVKIKQLFVDLVAESLLVRVGKQKVQWGPGFSWNPSNYFGAATKLDYFAAPPDNLNLVNVELVLESLTANLTIELGKNPEDMLYAGKINFPIEILDLSLSGFTHGSRRGFGGTVVLEFDNNMFYFEGAARSGESRPVVVQGASGYELSSRDQQWYPRLVGGYYRIFEDTSFLCLEYCFNGDGWSPQERDNYFAGRGSAELASSREMLYALPVVWMGQMQKNYGVFIANVPNFPFQNVRVGINAALNFDDWSGVVTPEIRYDISENVYLSLNGNIFWGGTNTEFGSVPVSAIANLTLNLFY